MSADRPDRVESAYTILPGNFQIETALYSLSSDESEQGEAEVETRRITVNDFHLRAGTTENGEIQFMLPTYIEQKTETNGDEETIQGAGDLTLRYRQNLYGNDGGSFAFAIMPHLKIPTAQDDFTNDRVEGGVMFPFAFKLPEEWQMGTMFSFERAFNKGAQTWRTDYIMTTVFSRPLVGSLAGFIELYSEYSDDKNKGAVGTFDFGLTWQYIPTFQLDAGVFVGITEAAPDKTGFIGASLLF